MRFLNSADSYQLAKRAYWAKIRVDEEGNILVDFKVRYSPNRPRTYTGHVTQVFRESYNIAENGNSAQKEEK